MKRPSEIPIQYLKGVGPRRKSIFSRLNIATVEDLLYFFPRRYEDRSQFVAIAGLKPGVAQTIKGKVLAASLRRSLQRGIFLFQAVIADSSGKMECLWFHQPYLKEYLKPNTNLVIYGEPQQHGNHWQMINPEYEILDGENDQDNLNVGRIVPIYPLTEGLTQRQLRRLIKSALDEFITGVADILPFDIRSHRKLVNLAQALLNIHFPNSFAGQQAAYLRLAFEEFFLAQTPVLLRKQRIKAAEGIAHNPDEDFLKEVMAILPFKLTHSQEKVLEEIKMDMASSRPMHRLLQGDVGSGKTIVAFLASLMAIHSGSQAALMVPTEILARQHFANAQELVKKVSGDRIKVAVLTSGIAKAEKEKLYRQIEKGEVNWIIGTHALLEEGLRFSRLGLAVIDEQHKFGVSQRQILPAKGKYPDLLIMTATPIPRTLSLTLYGDLDISLIEEGPAGRPPVVTQVFDEKAREKVYSLLREKILQGRPACRRGRQAYIIYPIIEESEMLDLRAAEKMYAQLKKKEFAGLRLGLVHGRLKPALVEKTINRFRDGNIDILVATTILEVGMDIPNAACMIIEHCERFGLAQLHQLRGRIGRGAEQSFCFLIAGPKNAEAEQRIKAIAQTNDGFKIAEEDLRIRGPGEFFGKRQHGLSALRIANPLTQMHILKAAREEAARLIKEDPGFALRQNRLIRDYLARRFPDYARVVLGG
ncbi:MAG: ATP-dependent DNA helicase RecG [Candidatus Omnitrophota bacterium]